MAEKRKVWRVKDDSGALEQVLVETSAEQVTVADTAGKLTATNVEAALQELATNIANAGKVDDVKDVNGNSIVTNKVATLSKTAVGLSNVTNDAQVKRSEMGVANGVATLDTAGKVPSSQLPSYVDDVLEYANKAGFPTTGESGKIYVAKDTNLTYRWSGTAYIEISPSLALGETSSTAYAGDKGKANADNIAKIINGPTKVKKAEQADSATNATNAGYANVAETATKISNKMEFLGYQDSGAGPEAVSETKMEYNGSSVRKLYFGDEFRFLSTDGTGNTDPNKDHRLTLKNTGVVEGAYSAVKVDIKGRVTKGGNSIEWGIKNPDGTSSAPSENLMVGGLFFELQ